MALATHNAMETTEEVVHLVRRTLAGDVGAFEELVDRYRGLVYRIILRMTESPDVAADLGQQTFLMAFESLRKLREHASFKAWLASIAVNCCRDYQKDLRRNTSGIEDEEVIETTPFSARIAGPQESAERAELRGHLDRALAVLRPNYREAVLLRDVEGFSFEEMEKITGINQTNLKMRVARARVALRELLLSWGVR